MANSAITFNTSGLASATSPGLVGTGAQTFAGKKTLDGGALIKGDTSGVAIGSGYVGQIVSGLSDAPTSVSGSNTDKLVTTLPLTAGQWLITGQVYLDPGTSNTMGVTRLQCNISTGTNATVGSLGTDFVEGYFPLTSGYVIAIFNFNLRISADTTYNVNARPVYSGTAGATPIRAVIRALRVA